MAKKTYRLPGESKKACVARKIPLNRRHGMSRRQSIGAAYNMCSRRGK